MENTIDLTKWTNEDLQDDITVYQHEINRSKAIEAAYPGRPDMWPMIRFWVEPGQIAKYQTYVADAQAELARRLA